MRRRRCTWPCRLRIRRAFRYALTRMWPPETRGVWTVSFFRGAEMGQGANGEGPTLGVATCKALLALAEWLKEG
jgi:hypothetical protein